MCCQVENAPQNYIYKSYSRCVISNYLFSNCPSPSSVDDFLIQVAYVRLDVSRDLLLATLCIDWQQSKRYHLFPLSIYLILIISHKTITYVVKMIDVILVAKCLWLYMPKVDKIIAYSMSQRNYLFQLLIRTEREKHSSNKTTFVLLKVWDALGLKFFKLYFLST